MNEFNFSLQPGKKEYKKIEYNEQKPIISVVIPFYNSGKYIEQTIITVLNQTFPYYEVLIVDDGSKDEESLKKLEEIEKMDARIKVFHKQNEGLAATRDFGAIHSSECTKYLMFLDDDDLIEPTFFECAYWTLETNKEASWAYADSVGFGTMEYTWNKYFNSDKLKKVNELISEAFVRKSDFNEVKGYELREKAVNEDWNFWLKLLSKGKYPVHMSFYGQWYRRKETGELKKASDNQKRSLEIINETASKITKQIDAIQYPRYKYNYDILPEEVPNLLIPTAKYSKKEITNILFIIPWMITGGADLFNLNLIKGLDKKKFNVTIITTEPNKNVLRQYFEQDNENNKIANVYDLTSFLDQKYWLAFINYIIKKENINIILNSNSKFGYYCMPYLKAKYSNIPILDYVHMEEWYNRNGGYSRYSSMYSSLIDKTLICNENSRKVLIEHFKRDEKETETVYIGVDEEKFNPDNYNKEELTKKYIGENINKKIITYICRISEQKRPLLLLEIIAKLKKERQDFKVLVVGDGNLLPKMKARAQELGLGEEVMFLGNIVNTAEIYRISDVTVNCSLKEGLALTAYESLSMGVPVISSDVGGQKELVNNDVGKIVKVVQNEEDIYLEKYSEKEIQSYVDSINEILNNLEFYKSNCRKRILNNFTIKNMIQKMSIILEETAKKPNINKIENGKGLLNNINIGKELITTNLKNDEIEYKWECTEYEKATYGQAYSMKKMNYKKEIIKEKLWKIPMWRGFIKAVHKIRH
jgi:glycosyltransferase, group 2 family